MKKQLVTIGIIALFVSVGLSGCNEQSPTNEKTPDLTQYPPTVSIDANPTTGIAPLTVNFNVSMQFIGSSYSSCRWDFGDGSTSTSLHPYHTFTNSGTYTVRVTILNSDGLTGTDSKQIIVTQPQEKDPDYEKVVGTWITDYDNIIRTYREDGSVFDSLDGYDGTWDIINHKIVFTNKNGYTTDFDYILSNNYNTLTLIGIGISTILTRQENTTKIEEEKAIITNYIAHSRITKRNTDGSSSTYSVDGFSYKWENEEGMFRDYQVIATVKNVAGEYLNEIVIKAKFLDENGNDLNIERTATVTGLPNTYTKDTYFYVFDSETIYYDNVESVTFEIVSTS
jgi:PKD repeat protein